MADSNSKPDLTWVWVGLGVLVLLGFFVFHQSIAPVKTPKINLVPEGTQKAYDPYYLQQLQYQQQWNQIPPQYAYSPNAAAYSDAAYWNGQAAQQLGDNMQQIALYQQAGNFLNNLSDNIFGY